jgi:hypothetical protein
MRILVTLILSLLIILALLSLLMSALGISLGFRVGGNLFADESASIGATYLLPVILLSFAGLYILWRGGGSRR